MAVVSLNMPLPSILPQFLIQQLARAPFQKSIQFNWGDHYSIREKDKSGSEIPQEKLTHKGNRTLEREGGRGEQRNSGGWWALTRRAGWSYWISHHKFQIEVFCTCSLVYKGWPIRDGFWD